MLSRARVALAALVLTASTFAATPPAPAAADAGVCPGNIAIQQLFVDKEIGEVSGADYFDGVRGDATIQSLDICFGVIGGSWVLPANVQNDSNGKIFQLGYGQGAGDDFTFVYANGSPNAIAWRTWTPIEGERYTFTITRSAGYPAFRITRQSTGESIYKVTDANFGMGFDRTWWGYEANDKASSLGPLYGTGDVNMAYMGYSADNGGWIYRSGLANAYGDRPTYPNRMHKHLTFSDSNNIRSGHIGDWVYGGDKFNVHTH